MKNKSALWITTTAVLIAMLIGLQAVSASFGQIVTGSLVNMILIIAVMKNGLASGLTVAFVSPVFARLLGIGPFWVLIPFLMLGNAVLVIIWHLLGRQKFTSMLIVRMITLITAAIGKFITVYVGVVLIAIPFLLDLPENQAAVISGVFSIMQFFTASIGGGVALMIMPVINKMKPS